MAAAAWAHRLEWFIYAEDALIAVKEALISHFSVGNKKKSPNPAITSAVKKIQAKTKWTLRRVALEARVVPETLRKIVSGATATPGADVCQSIETLYNRVRRMK